MFSATAILVQTRAVANKIPELKHLQLYNLDRHSDSETFFCAVCGVESRRNAGQQASSSSDCCKNAGTALRLTSRLHLDLPTGEPTRPPAYVHLPLCGTVIAEQSVLPPD
jgi:hypothetical protein